jgi:hypothetical protein
MLWPLAKAGGYPAFGFARASALPNRSDRVVSSGARKQSRIRMRSKEKAGVVPAFFISAPHRRGCAGALRYCHECA